MKYIGRMHIFGGIFILIFYVFIVNLFKKGFTIINKNKKTLTKVNIFYKISNH